MEPHRYLVMQLGGILVASRVLEYEPWWTHEDKTHAQHELVKRLTFQHKGIIQQSACTPRFFVAGEPSKGNIFHESELEENFATI